MRRDRERRAARRGGPRACRVKSAWRRRRAAAAPADGAELLDDRRGRALAELDDRPGEERPARRAGRPAEDDRALEADARPARGRDALVPAARGSAGRACRRSAATRRRRASGAAASGSRATSAAEGLEDDAGGAGLVVEGERRRRRSSRELGEAGDAVGQRRVDAPASARRPASVVRRDVVEVGGAQVDVRRVELVRLDRQRVEALEGGAAVGREPVGLARRRAPRRAPRRGVKVSSVGARRGARAGGPARPRRGSGSTSVTRASPPSRASRAG